MKPMQKKKYEMKNNKVKCPYCGKKIDRGVICPCEVKGTGLVDFWK